MTPQAVLLAGGLGTRLGALTRATPKPLLPVAGRPFLAHLADHLAGQGVTRLLILAGHLGDQVAAFAAEFVPPGRHGLSAEVLVEPAPLGTAGALAFAADRLEPEFFLLNADTFFDAPLADLAAAPLSPASAPCLGRLALRPLPDTGRYGTVRRTGTRIDAFAPRPPGPGAPGEVNGGVALLDRRILAHIPPGPASLEADVLPRLAALGALHGIPFAGRFIDIGVPEDYARAALVLPGPARALFLDRDGVINEDTGHPHRIADLAFIPGALETVALACAQGWRVFVATNQAGIAKGLYGEADMHRLHAFIAERAAAAGGRIAEFRHCPHHPGGVVPELSVACGCRKPAPGMLADLIARHGLDPGASLMIGDRESDMAAARAAGVRGARFPGGDLLAFAAPLLSRAKAPA